MEFAISQAGNGAVIRFENDRVFFRVAIFKILVETVVGDIQLAILKPFVKRGIGFVQHFGERFVPEYVFTRQLAPEPFVVLFSFLAQRPICIHAGDCRVLLQTLRMDNKNGFLFFRMDLLPFCHSCFFNGLP